MSVDLVRFEDFELDLRAYHLRRSGRSLRLERIPTEVLRLLVQRQGQLVSREEIIEKLWGKNVFLDTDNAINTAIRNIRQALHDDPEQPRFVQTVTGRGYRFIAQVAEVSAPPASQGHLDRQSRYSLKFIVPLVAGLALAVLGTGYLMRPHLFVKSATPHARVMLAVLPFQNLSNDSDQEYFSDGLTEETITDLGELSPENLGVIARTSALAYKHTQKSASQIGKELGVDYILEGSVRREGERVRISAQLIRVKDQTHIWAQSYNRDMRDFLAVQNELGGAIAGQVQVSLTPEQKREHSKIPHIDPDAYDDYLKGRYYADKITTEDFKKAIDFFQKAIDKDPSYAAAYGEISRSYTMLAFFGYLPTAEAYPKAIAAAKHAIEMDNNLAEAHVALGHASSFCGTGQMLSESYAAQLS
jgi:TolB-like protein/DNA-binding winged helix-turn-helix (wHTH) protein